MKKNRVDEFITNPKKALLILATPILIGMLVQTLYNVVDTAFVGRLGAESIAALTFSFPLFFILISLTVGVGAGINSLIARKLGEKNKIDAENAAMHGLLISILLSLIVFLLGYFALNPIFRLFGAEENVIGLAVSYMSIILFGFFFMFPAFTLNGIFVAQGNSKTAMQVQISGLILNIILDPIFIYTFKLGVRGAAFATIISFFFSLILYLYLLSSRSYLKIHPSSFRFSSDIIIQILKVGAPSTIMMLLMSVYSIFINRFMAHFGTDYVAALGISSRLESVVVMPFVAFSLALLTIVGMFYGAKRLDLVKVVLYYSLKIGIIWTLVSGAIIFSFPKLFLLIFTNDQFLINIGSAYLRINVFLFPFLVFSLMISRALQGMGYGLPGLLINLVRVVFISIPAGFIFVFILDYSYLSIALATVLGAIISAIFALIMLNIELRKSTAR
ncbi:MAG: MATE family efflux transporter [Candidatus Woesearchaeota archaeon]